jgi:hypothetical protein
MTMKIKIPYEPPTIIDLSGKFAHAVVSVVCKSGSAFQQSQCSAGGSPGQQCASGGTAYGGSCKAGSIASGACGQGQSPKR